MSPLPRCASCLGELAIPVELGAVLLTIFIIALTVYYFSSSIGKWHMNSKAVDVIVNCARPSLLIIMAFLLMSLAFVFIAG